jgi:hypothetical protein
VGVLSQERASGPGARQALRQLRDPLLLLLLPASFAYLVLDVGYATYSPLGFDFRGTLWEPARALLEGHAMYPEPSKASVVVGNPAVYPPLFVLASVPLALLPFSAAASTWFALMALAVAGSLWILGVRDWRCYALAVTSPPVLHGLFYGNLTVLLVLPLALAWRFRDRATLAGVASGAAIAGKLFLWPLVVWLLVTRRFCAAAWTVAWTLVFVIGVWAAVGFEGLRDYPLLLRAVQDVYAVRSTSLATVAGGFGASVSTAVAVAAAGGVILLGAAAWVSRRPDGDRRAFALVVAACIVASPIVWPNYAALLLVPIAVTWPRLGPVWFFGYLIWLAGVVVPPVEVAPGTCCKPEGVPNLVWGWSHQVPSPWLASGVVTVVVVVALAAAARIRSRGAAWRP